MSLKGGSVRRRGNIQRLYITQHNTFFKHFDIDKQRQSQLDSTREQCVRLRRSTGNKVLCSLKQAKFGAFRTVTMMARIPTSPTLEKPKNMFSTLFANVKGSSPRVSMQGIPPGEGDCLYDETLESAALTAIWRSSSSKVTCASLSLD